MAAPPAAARDVSHALAPAYVWQLRVEHFGALQTASEATGLGGLKRVPGTSRVGALSAPRAAGG